MAEVNSCMWIYSVSKKAWHIKLSRRIIKRLMARPRMHRTVLNMARCKVLLPISRYATGEMLKSTLHTS